MTDLHPDQIIELTIDGCGAGGEGIGRVGGRAVFVPFAAPGERIRARVVHQGARRVVAAVDEVLAPSPDRVEPACPVFGRCGGCSLQHLAYPAQLAFKRTVLADALRSVAGLDRADPIPVAPAEPPWEYRNRGQYPVARVDGRVVTGFFAPRSHRVVPTSRCPIHHPDLDAAVGLVRAWAGQKKVPIYDEGDGTGWLRHVVVRRATVDGRLLVTLVGATERSARLGDLVGRLRRRLPAVAGLALNLNPDRTNVILGPQTQQVWGQGFIEEAIGRLRFRLSTGSFFQVNTLQAQVLFERVGAFLADVGGPVVDAYCGVGVLAQLLADAGAEVIGIELAEPAVADARSSAERNGLSPTFHRGRVERVLPRLVADGLRPGAVVLDPPRKGADPAVLQALADSGCERIAYVSCHPGSLARDLARLFELGFEVEVLEAVDMFPQTAHLETFAGLRRA